MSFESAQGTTNISFPSAEDLSADQYRFMVLNSSGLIRRPDATQEFCVGVLQNGSVSEAKIGCDIKFSGITKVVAGETLVIGDYVTAEYISAADAGKAIKCTTALNNARGVVVEGGAENDLISILLIDKSQPSVLGSANALMGAATANTTTSYPIMNVTRPIKITKIAVSSITVPVDADGTLLLNILAHDDSENI